MKAHLVVKGGLVACGYDPRFALREGDPARVTCKACKRTNAWKQRLAEWNKPTAGSV